VGRAARVLLVPTEVALAFTAERGWHTLPALPPGWEDAAEAQLEADHRRWAAPALSLVPALPVVVTACRPGAGPCRRRHEHASARRTS
jgi:hypothetical protein